MLFHSYTHPIPECRISHIRRFQPKNETEKKKSPSISLPRRFRTRSPTHTPLIPPSLPQPLLGGELQLTLQLWTGFFSMDKIAEATAHAAFAAVKSAAGFAEVGDGRKFAVDGAGGVPAAIQCVAGGLGRVFVFEACVDVADEI